MKTLKVCVINLEDRKDFDIEIEEESDITDADFLRLAEQKNQVYSLKQFEAEMSGCEPIDFDHCFMRFLLV